MVSSLTVTIRAQKNISNIQRIFPYNLVGGRERLHVLVTLAVRKAIKSVLLAALLRHSARTLSVSPLKSQFRCSCGVIYWMAICPPLTTILLVLKTWSNPTPWTTLHYIKLQCTILHHHTVVATQHHQTLYRNMRQRGKGGS